MTGLPTLTIRPPGQGDEKAVVVDYVVTLWWPEKTKFQFKEEELEAAFLFYREQPETREATLTALGLNYRQEKVWTRWTGRGWEPWEDCL